MQLLFLSGSKTLLWSEIQRFSPSNMSCFFSLDRRGCFGAKLSDFSASNMQLFFFLSGSKRLLWSEIERVFSLEHAAVFRSGSKRLFWSEIERFFQPGSKRLLWSEIVRFSARTCSCFFSLSRRGCFWIVFCLILVLAPITPFSHIWSPNSRRLQAPLLRRFRLPSQSSQDPARNS